MGRFVTVVALAMCFYHLFYLLRVLDAFGLYLISEAYRGLSLAFILFLAFLLIPATKGAPRDRLPWYDAILALIALAGPVCG